MRAEGCHLCSNTYVKNLDGTSTRHYISFVSSYVEALARLAYPLAEKRLKQTEGLYDTLIIHIRHGSSTPGIS